MPRECPVTLQAILHPVMCNDGRHYELEAVVEHCIGKTKAQLLCPLTNVKLISVIYSFDMKEDLDNEYKMPGAGKLEKRYDGYNKGYTKDEYMQALKIFFEQSDDATPFALPLKKQAAATLITEKIQSPLTDEQLWAKIDERGDEPPESTAELLQLLRLPPRRASSPASDSFYRKDMSSLPEFSPSQELSLFEGAEIADAFDENPISAGSDVDRSHNVVNELPDPYAFDNSASLPASPMPSFSLHPYQEQLAEAPKKAQLLKAIKFFEVGRAHARQYPSPTPYSIAPYCAEYATVRASQREEYVENLRMFQYGVNEEQKSGLHEEYFCEECENDINLAKNELLNPHTILSDRHFLNLLIKHGAALLDGLPAQNPLQGSNITLANILAAADKRAERGQFDLGPYVLSHQALCRTLKSDEIFNIGKNDPESAGIIIDTFALYSKLSTNDQQELKCTVNTGEGINRRYPRSYLGDVANSATDSLCAACEKDLNQAKAEILTKYTTLAAKHILQLLNKHGIALLPDLTPQNLFKQTKIRLPHLVATAEKHSDIGRYILSYPELWLDLKRRDLFRIGKIFATNGRIILNQAELNNKLLEQDREELRLTMRMGESYDQRQNRTNQNEVTQRPGF